MRMKRNPHSKISGTYPNMTSKTIFDRIRGMKEIYRMWRMVRLLYKKGFFLEGEIPWVEKEMKDAEPDKRPFIKLAGALMHSGSPKVSKIKLYSFFVMSYFCEYFWGGQGVLLNQHPKHMDHIKFATSILNSCMESSNNFIKEDPNEFQVFITDKGKKFAGIDGLLVEWAKYLKPLGLASIVAGLWVIAEVVFHIKW